MALETKGLAASATLAIREAYMDVARQWAALADEMQHNQKLTT